MSDKIKVGISACLLGKNVRYNGGHKLEPLLVDTLGQYLEFIPICPEVEAGLGIPREPARLVGSSDSPRVKTLNTGTDLTDRMLKWTTNLLNRLEKENLCGFIFKSKSPSCQIEGKVCNKKGAVVLNGVGILAHAFMERFPFIPVIDEVRFRDVRLREKFVQEVRAKR